MNMEPLLVKGVDVVCDRYIASSLAYQALDHDMEYIWKVNEKFRRPDLMIFLDVSVDTCLGRLEERAQQDPFETREVLTKAHSNYRRALGMFSEHGEPVVVVDGALPEEEVANLIWHAVRPIIEPPEAPMDGVSG